MSEVKTNEPVKQEGEFKIKKKTTPKKLTETKDNITKVNVNPKEPLVELKDSVTKVEIKKEDDAIQIGETKEVSGDTSSGDSDKMEESVSESNETTEGFSPIQEVTEAEVKEVEAEVKEAIRDEKVLGKPLPENIEKLVSFMEERWMTMHRSCCGLPRVRAVPSGRAKWLLETRIICVCAYMVTKAASTGHRNIRMR